MKISFQAFLAILLLWPWAPECRSQGTVFTFQGRLTQDGAPADGNYDLTFSLFTASSGGTQVGGTLTNLATPVSNGLFSVMLDFGPAAFSGSARWLSLGVRAAGSSSFVALSPLQPITSAPYAIMAATSSNLTGVLPSSAVQGTYGQAVVFNNAANQLAGNGHLLTGVNAVTLAGLGASGFWQTAGNTGLAPTNGNFLGTLDGQALEFRVNATRALRLEPTAGPPNIIGGSSDNAVSSGTFGATISGGSAHLIDLASHSSTIGGGTNNIIQDSAGGSTIGGGTGNLVLSTATAAVIAGGYFNQAGAPSAAISGGEYNNAGGYGATVPGGTGNLATGDYSFAAGNQANAANAGAFVWADSADYSFPSLADNEFAVRATGGVRFVSAIDTNGVPRAGVQLAAGGGSWSSLSDRAAKTNFVEVDSETVLERLSGVPITSWNYRTEAPDIRHIGPMAQDFRQAFGVGEDNRHITTIDAEGVALAAIQGLNRKLEAQKAAWESRLAAREAEIQALKDRLEAIEKQLQ